MKKDVLKIVLFVIILITPIAIIISESNSKPLLERVEKEGYSKRTKDPRWEFVKYEIGEGKIDLNVNYVEKYKDPILFSVADATIKDSAAIDELMKELRIVFPLKEVAYFSEFVGQDYDSYVKEKKAAKDIKMSFDEIMSYTIHLSFIKQAQHIQYTNSLHTSYNIKDRNEDIGRLRAEVWNMYYNSMKLIFGFDDNVSIERRQVYITAEFFERLWKSYYKNFENPTLLRSDFRRDETKWIRYSDKMISPIINVNDSENGFTQDHGFLLKKLFSTDFRAQFETYMYKTYPWRYANIFIDKDGAKKKVNAIISFLGVLILIFGFTLFWNKKFNHPFLSYFLPILVFFMTFMSLQFLNTYLIHLDYLNHSFKEIIIFLILILSFAIIISFLLWQLEKRLVSDKVSFGYQLFFKLALTFLLLNLPLIAVIILKNSNSENHIEIFPFLYLVIGLTLGRGLLIYLNHFSDSLVKEKDVELSRLKEVNAQSELKLLQSHINPHFLYNALNSIAGLAHNNPDKTEKMALSLSNLFRYSINKKGQKMSTVKEEVVMVENYLDIEKIRFGERLKFTLHVDEALENEQIPMYILQPLVENAIKHGVSEIRGEGHIVLEIKKELEAIVINVSDNGPDFPEGLVSGHGLQTIYDLLRLSYGDKASLKWQNTPKKQISILINELI